MSVPDLKSGPEGALYQIPGLPPDPAHLPAGCPLRRDAAWFQDICRREFPPLIQLTPHHESLCHFAKEVYGEHRSSPFVI